MRGQFIYTPYKCLAKTILLLDMYRTSYIQSIFVVCTLHALCKPWEGWTSFFFVCWVWIEVFHPWVCEYTCCPGRGRTWKSLAEIIPKGSFQASQNLPVILILLHSVLLLLRCIFFLSWFLKWSDSDQCLSFHFYIIKDVVWCWRIRRNLLYAK